MKNKNSHSYIHLKKKWLKKQSKAQEKLWVNHKPALEWLHDSSRQFIAGSVAGLLLLASPLSTGLFSNSQNRPALLAKAIEKKDQLTIALSSVLPKVVSPLNDQQETAAGQILSQIFKVRVSASLDGKRLNRSYGYIGKEQHLMRYPGDTIATHFETPEEARVFAETGMAPGKGAWGYFTRSKNELSQTDILREKYYIAVQTFLAPSWQSSSSDLSAFFKYRKMLVVNPDNGKGVVAVIGDAGPGTSTGKHLGGSPEVMTYLEREDGAAKGPVLYFFIDDPDNTVPLGPINVK